MARRFAAATIVALCGVFVFLAPAKPATYDNDQYLYQSVVDRMRSGASYYEASEQALREVGGAAETTRAVRPPTAFLLWRVVPDALLWPLFVLAVAGASGLLLASLSTVPLAAVLTTIYLLVVGRTAVEWLFVEAWTVPLVAASLWADERRRGRAAAVFGATATAVRELAGAFLAWGVLRAIARRRSVVAWSVAAALIVVLYGIHTVLVHPHLVHEGTEEPLLWTGSPSAVLAMAGFQLPFSRAAGAVLTALAVLGSVRVGRLEARVPIIAFPLIGLIADRPYWGLMVVPFTLVWAVEGISQSLSDVVRRPREAPASSP